MPRDLSTDFPSRFPTDPVINSTDTPASIMVLHGSLRVIMAHYRLCNAAYRKPFITLPKESPIRTPRNYHQGFPTKLPLRTPTADPHRTPRRFTQQKKIRVSDPHHSTHRSLLKIPTGSHNSAQTRVSFRHRPHASAKGPRLYQPH